MSAESIKSESPKNSFRDELGRVLDENFKVFLKTIFYRRGIAESYDLVHYLPSDFQNKFTVQATLKFLWAGVREDWGKYDNVSPSVIFEVGGKTYAIAVIELINQLFYLAPNLLIFNQFVDTIKAFFHTLLNQYLSPISEKIMLKVYNPLILSLGNYLTEFYNTLSDKIAYKYKEPLLPDRSGLLLPIGFPKRVTPCYSFVIEYSLFNLKTKEHNVYTRQIDLFYYMMNATDLAICIDDPTSIFRDLFNREYIYNPFSPILYYTNPSLGNEVRIPLMTLKGSEFKNYGGLFSGFLSFDALLFTKRRFTLHDLVPSEYHLVLRAYHKDFPSTIRLERDNIDGTRSSYSLTTGGVKDLFEMVVIDVKPTTSFAFEELRYTYQIEVSLSPDNTPAVVIHYIRKDKLPFDNQDRKLFEQYQKAECDCYPIQISNHEARVTYRVKLDEVDKVLSRFYKYYRDNFAESQYLAYLISKLDSKNVHDVNSREVSIDKLVEGYFFYTEDLNYYYDDLVQFRYIFGDLYVEFYVNGWIREIFKEPVLIKVSRAELKHWNWIGTIMRKIIKLISKRTDLEWKEIDKHRYLVYSGTLTKRLWDIAGNKETKETFSNESSYLETKVPISNILIEFDFTKYTIVQAMLVLADGSRYPFDKAITLNASTPSELVDFPMREEEAKPEVKPPAIEKAEEISEEDWFYPIPRIILLAQLDADGTEIQLNLKSETEVVKEKPWLKDTEGRQILEILGNIEDSEIWINHVDPAATRKARKKIILKKDTEIRIIMAEGEEKIVKIKGWQRLFEEGDLLFESLPDPFDVSLV